MPGILTFRKAEIQSVIEEVKAAKTIRPNFEQRYDPEYLKDGVEAPRNIFDITEDMIDFSKLDPSIWLVGDRGVYIMGSGDNFDPKKSPVAYAEESNPETVEDWHEAKRAIFGGDDGCDALPIAEIEAWLSLLKGDKAQISLTETSMRFLG